MNSKVLFACAVLCLAAVAVAARSDEVQTGDMEVSHRALSTCKVVLHPAPLIIKIAETLCRSDLSDFCLIVPLALRLSQSLTNHLLAETFYYGNHFPKLFFYGKDKKDDDDDKKKVRPADQPRVTS